MGWQDWHYWKKGAIIASTISIIFLVISIITEGWWAGPATSSTPNLLAIIPYAMYFVVIIPAAILGLASGIDSPFLTTSLFGIIVSIIIWTTIGGLLGKWYEKRKNKAFVQRSDQD